jgi:ribonuclease HI
MLDFGDVVFVHVPREQNTLADAEANKAMDSALKQPNLL